MEDRYKYNKYTDQWKNWEEQAPAESWDEPTVQVWDRIESELPPTSRRRRWWFLLLFIPILGGMVWWGGQERGTRNEGREDSEVSGFRDQVSADNQQSKEIIALLEPQTPNPNPTIEESGGRGQGSADHQQSKEIITRLEPQTPNPNPTIEESGSRGQGSADNQQSKEIIALLEPQTPNPNPTIEESGSRDQVSADHQQSKEIIARPEPQTPNPDPSKEESGVSDQVSADHQQSKEIIARPEPQTPNPDPNKEESGVSDQISADHQQPKEIITRPEPQTPNPDPNKEESGVSDQISADHQQPKEIITRPEPQTPNLDPTIEESGVRDQGRLPSLLSPPKNQRFFLASSYTYLRPQAKVTNLNPTPPIRAREQSVNSNEWGLHVGYRINKRWSVRTGLSRYQISVLQQQVFRRDFDRMRETPTADGNFKSSYDLSVNGKYGQTDFEVDFIRAAGEQITDGTPIFLIVATRQQLNMIHIPLMIEYEQAFGAFQWSLQTGPSLSILEGQQQEVSASPRVLRTYNLRVRNLVERTDLSKTTLDWQFGTEIRYAFTPALAVYVNPQYRFGLQDLTSTDTQRTRVHSFGLGLGVRLNLK